jgi:hypothetical protein
MTRLKAENIRAVEVIYFSAMLEDAKFFNVMDRLVALFQSGLLPIETNATAGKLYKYWKQNPRRLSSKERKDLYSRVLGIGGKDAGPNPNREFNDLLLRFISAVSVAKDQTPVRRAGRDLAANLSRHGFGFTYYAAAELESQIETITSLLSAPDMRSVYGAKDMWQVIDKVAALDLGGARNTVRYRTLAQSGATVISWLSRKTAELIKDSDRPILTAKRDDRRLVAACEAWLQQSVTSNEL